MSVLLFLSLAAVQVHAAPPRAISDAEIARIAAAPYDRRAKMNTSEVLGTNRGMNVIASYPCSDVCPNYTTRIIRYDRPAGPACTAAGGVNVQRLVPRGIAVHQEAFCVPRAVAGAQRR